MADHAAAGPAGGSAGAPTPEPAPAGSAPARWYAPAWQAPPACETCGTHHWPPSRGVRLVCQRPGFRPYPVCPECRYTVDPVAVAEFDGRHAECSLPLADRAMFRSVVHALGRARRAAQLDREAPAA